MDAARMSKGIVLYVEDNTENRALVRRVLEVDGVTVQEAANAPQALASLSAGRPDLILMDISMPGVDGYTLTRQIKGMAGCEQIPVIAVTANVMRGDREKSLQAGCDGYIQKPIDIDTIAQQIERYLTKR
jgi:two-component system cell cycle response regulator DivK